MKKPVVSVVIPTYKRADFLVRAMDSVFQQTFSDWEIIVVDDNAPGSSFRKRTEKVMKKYSSDNQVRYIKHRKNKGSAGSRNTGVANSSGKYIAFLDDDDEWYPAKLSKQLKVFRESDVFRLALVHCDGVNVDSFGNLFPESKHRFRGRCLREFLIANKGIGNSGLLIRSDALKKIGGFREGFFDDDWALELDLLLAGYGFDYVPEVLMQMNAHDKERMTTSSRKLEGMNQDYQELRKHISDLDFLGLLAFYSNYHNRYANYFALNGMRMKALLSFLLSAGFNPLSVYRRKVLIRILFGNRVGDKVDRFLCRVL